MEQIIMFISNPFLQVDIGELTAKFQQVYEQNHGLDMEIIAVQNDRELKARSWEKDFWGLVNREVPSSDILCTQGEGLLWFHIPP